jgi:DNA-directed RNA polymerase subunit RPC12/RpoP
MIIKKFNENLNETYFKCECGSDTFIRLYNVWNEKIKVKVTEENGEEFWDIEELGKEKDHLYGYICAECRQDNDELNDGL